MQIIGKSGGPITVCFENLEIRFEVNPKTKLLSICEDDLIEFLVAVNEMHDEFVGIKRQYEDMQTRIEVIKKIADIL